MKRLMIVMLALMFVVSAVAMAGGDQNRDRHGQSDDDQGQGDCQRTRTCPECDAPVGPGCPQCLECGCPLPPGEGDQQRNRQQDGSCND